MSSSVKWGRAHKLAGGWVSIKCVNVCETRGSVQAHVKFRTSVSGYLVIVILRV